MASRMRVRGTPELQARLRAIGQTFKPVGRQWANKAKDNARRTSAFNDRSGKGRRSIRVRNANTRRATVVANYYIAILDTGAKAHTIVPRRAGRLAFQADGRTVFARKVHKPASRGLGFGVRAGRDALRETPMADELIRLWNEAAS